MLTWKKIIFVSLQIAIIARIVWLAIPEEETPDYKKSFSPRKEAVLFSDAIDEEDLADYTDEIRKYTQQISEIARDENFKEMTDSLFGQLERLDKVENGKWAAEFQTPKMSSDNTAKQRAKVDDHDSAAFGKGTTVNILTAEFEVTQAHIDQLPEKLRVGLFAKPRVYPAIVRVSHAKGSTQDYMRLAVRMNMAEDPAAREQWNQTMSLLSMESTPIFLMRDLRELRTVMRMLDKKAGKFSKFLTLLQGGVFDALSIKKNSGIVYDNFFDIITNTSVLAKDYYSCAPYALGANNIFKFKFASNLQVDNPIEREGHLDLEAIKLLSEQVSDSLAKEGASFDFQIQIATDKSRHEADCASCYWGLQGVDAVDVAEDGHYRGGYITMGKLTIPQQTLSPIEEEIAHVNSELAKVLPNSKVLYFNSGESPFPPIGGVQLFRTWIYSRYTAKFMSFVLGKETEVMKDYSFDKKTVGEDKWLPVKGGASTECPFSTIAQSLGL